MFWSDLLTSLEKDPVLAIGLFSGLAGITVFVLGQVVNFGAQIVRFYRERRNLVQALYAEIDFNTSELEVFLGSFGDMEALKQRIEDKATEIPHIADARHTIVYTQNVPRLGILKPAIISRLIEFYGLMNGIKEHIDSLNRTSYEKLQPEFKFKMVEHIKGQCEKAMS
ncbi:MAG: hypothetical protein AAF826_13225 [Pseudomonadota bacterium]